MRTHQTDYSLMHAKLPLNMYRSRFNLHRSETVAGAIANLRRNDDGEQFTNALRKGGVVQSSAWAMRMVILVFDLG